MTGQTEGLKGGLKGWVDGWAEEWVDGWVRVYEAYEVNIKRGKIRCLLLGRKKKIFFYVYEVISWDVYDVITWGKGKNAPIFTTANSIQQFFSPVRCDYYLLLY